MDIQEVLSPWWKNAFVSAHIGCCEDALDKTHHNDLFLWNYFWADLIAAKFIRQLNSWIVLQHFAEPLKGYVKTLGSNMLRREFRFLEWNTLCAKYGN